MKLNKLQIRHFKGIRSRDIDFSGKSCVVSGQNETGKTTIADAITWLLFDKDTLGRSPAKFGIKTLENGQPIHAVDHSVEAEFDKIVLKKVYKEQWTRQKGAPKKSFTGHVTEYYVNEEPVKAKDYKAAVSEIMDEEMFRMLTVPNYFPEQMHWTDRLSILIDMCGINDDDVVEQDEGLAAYKEILGVSSHDGRRKILAGQRKKLDDTLDSIPARIDENQRNIVPVDGLDDAEEKIEALTKQKTSLEDKLATVRHGGGSSELEAQIQKLRAEQSSIESAFSQELDKKLESDREKARKKAEEADAISDEARKASSELQDIRDEIDSAMVYFNRASEALEAEQAKSFDEPESPDECPYCNQPMPDSGVDVKALREEFNAKKAEAIKNLKKEVRDKEDAIDELNGKAQKIETDLASTQEKLDKKESEVRKLKESIAEASNSAPDPRQSKDWQAAQKKIDALQAKVDKFASDRQAEREEVQQQIAESVQQTESYQSAIRQEEENEKHRKRVKELRGEMKEVQGQLESIEEQMMVLDNFERARADLVNSEFQKSGTFGPVEWLLFRDQINGGLEPCCEPLFRGVPFSEGLNRGGKILAGLHIINALSQYYGKSAPVMLDDMEGLTEPVPDLDLQVIAMKAVKGQEELKVEPLTNK